MLLHSVYVRAHLICLTSAFCVRKVSYLWCAACSLVLVLVFATLTSLDREREETRKLTTCNAPRMHVRLLFGFCRAVLT